MLTLPDLIKVLTEGDGYYAEDLVDKLNSHATVYLLAFFSVVTAGKLSIGDPIQCMVPPEFPSSWRNYYHQFCYVQNRIAFSRHITRSLLQEVDYLPDHVTDWESQPVYYQFVPFILAVQAIFFLFPRIFWKYAGTVINYGSNIESVLVEVAKMKEKKDEDRDKAWGRLARFVFETLDSQNRKNRWCFTLTIIYTIRKWLAFINVVVQFILISHLISSRGNSTDYLWGFEVLNTSMFPDAFNPVIGFFPRVIRCDASRITLGQPKGNHDTVQCVLAMNFINEKIFLAIYFWFIALAFINLIAAIRFTLFLALPPFREIFAETLIPPQYALTEAATAQNGGHRSHVNHADLLDFFISTILRTDGVLMLLLLHNHVGGFLTFELVQRLWILGVQNTAKKGNLPPGASMETLAFGGKGGRLVDIDDNGNDIKKPSLEKAGDEKKPILVEIDEENEEEAESDYQDPQKPSAPHIYPHLDNDDTLPLKPTVEDDYSIPPL